MNRFARALGIAVMLAPLALGLGHSALAARPPATETPTRTIVIVINGQPLETDQGARIVGGRVMLPLRVVFDALGVAVVKSGNTITGQLPTGRIVMTVGSANATVNGRNVRLDAPVAAIDGIEYVPLHFFGEALGAQTSYDGRGSKVEIISSLIGRNAGDQPIAGGGSRVRGIIAEVDRNLEPPTITVNVRGEARTISVNSDARVYVEDVTINSQLKGTLADMRVGDALLAVMAKDGKVVELHDFFRSTSGTVSAVSSAALVMSGGAVVTPSSSTEITLNDAPAKLADLHVGDEVAVRRNPETGEMRADHRFAQNAEHGRAGGRREHRVIHDRGHPAAARRRAARRADARNPGRKGDLRSRQLRDGEPNARGRTGRVSRALHDPRSFQRDRRAGVGTP